MVRKTKSIAHYKSKTPSPSPPTSRSHSESPIFKQEVEKTTPTAENLNTPDNCSLEPHKVQSLIHKLQGFSISQEQSELSQGSVTSHLTPSQ